MNLVYSLDNYLSTYYVPGFMAGTGNAIMDMRDIVSTLVKTIF